jgi:transcriptional regulator with AAA-type ATPase domain
MESLEQLKRFSSLPNIPLLVLGERGTGKTRTIETIVKAIKQREVITMACGGLDSSVAESLLFGHKKGSFTGADSDREGLLRLANDKVLFLDEIQDLPQAVQRKLVRVLQDSRHRYRPVGADIEECSEFELICASNQSDLELQKSLDPDFYDRISMLKVTIPPLRECREDIQADWRNVWNELRSNNHFPEQAPESEFLYNTLADNELTGNLRDLQKLAILVLAYWDNDPNLALQKAIELWKMERCHSLEPSLNNKTQNVTRDEHLNSFKKELALWAKDRYKTWGKAASNLNCNEKTLRQDAKGKVM